MNINTISIISALGVVCGVTIFLLSNNSPIVESNPKDNKLKTFANTNKIPLESSLVNRKTEQIPKPSFDIVQVDEKGDTIIAGRSAPHAHLIIMDGDKIIGEIQADSNGEWVFIPDMPLLPGTRNLRLGERTNPTSSTDPEVEDNRDIAISSESVVISIPGQNMKPNNKNSLYKEESALILKFPAEKNAPTEVLQIPDSDQKQEFELNITTVDYNDMGDITIGGTAPPGAIIYLYLDESLLGTAKAQGNGNWLVNPKKSVIPGHYTLRADHTDAKGTVISRVRYPFERAKNLKQMAKGIYVVVQPGNSLWRISRRAYGSGFNYTKIYKANSKQIENPDLIYPGQVFEIPDTQ
ncbi:MAG: hypothetical protein CFH06_00690 [Alphaproteobacteria bacterium MarineAlpha3_Bin5]|nr:hypothetical protein [Magnetovibrio sp.]PPR78703.1 MAG: hypothetical protein CFH06_00690 [Alphaproteobacteria bacterium MarineAlpha3_Bin5]